MGPGSFLILGFRVWVQVLDAESRAALVSVLPIFSEFHPSESYGASTWGGGGCLTSKTLKTVLGFGIDVCVELADVGR